MTRKLRDVSSPELSQARKLRFVTVPSRARASSAGR
jgi:hypothetical protein